MNIFKHLVIILFIGAISVSGAEYYSPQPQAESNIIVSGELESANSTLISTPRHWGLSYQIIYLAKEGTYVNKGDTIVKFDPHEVLTNIEQVQNELQEKEYQKQIVMEQNRQRIASIKQQIQTSEIQIQIYKNRLIQAQYSSDNERKSVELDLEKARLNLEKQKENLEAQKILNKNNLNSILMDISQSKVKLERQQRILKDMSIQAPRSGLVVHYRSRRSDNKVKKGDNVSPGDHIATIPDLNNMIAEIDLNEVDRLKIMPGQKAIIKVEAYPDTLFSGHVDYISKIVEFDFSRSFLKTYPMRVKINSNRNFRLKPGLTCQVEITTRRFDDAFSVPSWCLFKPDSNFCVKTSQNRLIPVQLVELGEGQAIIKGAINSEMRLQPNQNIPNF
ncbi:MAG TPA: efflux RND transporter periplasmic adaptor subunit [bacterium]|nr:efflux RND transporter periplasmic adaptor subunit [bacterium]